MTGLMEMRNCGKQRRQNEISRRNRRRRKRGRNVQNQEIGDEDVDDLELD